MKEILEDLIKAGLKELWGIVDAIFVVEEPKDLDNGDYASNVALVVAKQLDNPSTGSGLGNPKEIAESLAAYLNKYKSEEIESVSVAGAGFINFTLKQEYFAEKVKEIIERKDEWGKSDTFAGKKILVEHSSPNLFKPFHIGHLMNNTIGESITRLAQCSGAIVTTMTFPSDISLGVAKAIFILLEEHTTSARSDLAESVEDLGNAYVEGTKRYDEDESTHARIKEIADNLYGGIDSPEWKLFEMCKKLNISYFEHIVLKLGSHFDAYIYESEAGVVGKDVVQKETPRVFTQSEGAIVYIPDESRKDINTAVFINSQGNPTYEAKDIGLLKLKFDRYTPHTSIFVTDNQQVSHFEVVLDAAQKINREWSDKSLHVHHGRMSFKGQKMSSRLGGVPLVDDVLETVIQEVKIKNPDMSVSDAEVIAIAALKFSILRASVGKDINFDPDLSLSFDGDSGPYLQYSVVRAQSVLQKSPRQGLGISSSVRKDLTPVVVDNNWETTTLEKVLIHFPEIVQRSINEWAPHYVVGYLLDLAQSFNSWYATTKILDDTDASNYKLALTAAFAQTMHNGLHLLGIEVPEKM